MSWIAPTISILEILLLLYVATIDVATRSIPNEFCLALAQDRFHALAHALAAGFEILNEVVLNQVLVAFGDAEQTANVIAAIQAEGTCWAGITVWQKRTAMRISVITWATTDEDVERSADAMIRVARSVLR